jgi:methylated-DNA-[protein]-cysteine S-methyltransferase
MVEGPLNKIKSASTVTVTGGRYRRYRERLARNYVPYKHKEHSCGQPEEGYTWHMKKTFSDKVRDIVRKIPKSKTMTYKEVASKAGNPKAARAVGAVMRSNYDPSIPCHRVVASDGKMRGYKCGARIR